MAAGLRKPTASLNLFPDNPKMGYTAVTSPQRSQPVTPMLTSLSSAQSTPAAATNDPVLFALAAKRAELDARRGALSEQLAVLDRELANLDGAMQLFAPTSGSTLEATALSNRLVRQAIGFLRGELGHEAMAILRIVNRPLTAQQIARTLCERRQVTLDTPAFQRFCLLIVNNLRRREVRGLVRAVGRTEQRAVLWSVTAPPIPWEAP